jgi:hypothetical protein
MTEHIGEIQKEYGLYFYNQIKNLSMIDNQFINYLINLNDSVGNPIKYFIHTDIPNCSPNTLKYIYFGLLNVRYIQEKNLNNFDFIEIGGGYGGQCVILLSLFKHFNIFINKYLLIDLSDIVIFQLKYINRLIPNNNCEGLKFFNETSLDNYNFSQNSYLFSSYSLSELRNNIQKIYYDKLFIYLKYGFFVWNTGIINIPNKYIIQSNKISDVGTFVYLT